MKWQDFSSEWVINRSPQSNKIYYVMWGNLRRANIGVEGEALRSKGERR